MDKQKIHVVIAGHEFALVSDEPEAHVHRVADLVDAEIRGMREQKPSMSAVSSAILAATNFADSMIRAQETSDSLRVQIKDYLEEVARVKNELAETRREITRLKKEK